MGHTLQNLMVSGLPEAVAPRPPAGMVGGRRRGGFLSVQGRVRADTGGLLATVVGRPSWGPS